MELFDSEWDDDAEDEKRSLEAMEQVARKVATQINRRILLEHTNPKTDVTTRHRLKFVHQSKRSEEALQEDDSAELPHLDRRRKGLRLHVWSEPKGERPKEAGEKPIQNISGCHFIHMSLGALRTPGGPQNG